MRRLTIAIVLFPVLLVGASTSGFAQATTDPYTTNLGLRYDFFSHTGDSNSALGFNVDVTRMLGGFSAAGAPAAVLSSRSFRAPRSKSSRGS